MFFLEYFLWLFIGIQEYKFYVCIRVSMIQSVKKILIFCLTLFCLHLRASLLLDQFPDIKNNIAHIELATLPSPVYKSDELGKILNFNNIFIKRDDLTGCNLKNLYGGNKVRKLEFLLADALKKRCNKIVTLGSVGSNHCVATACYAQKLNFDCLLLLKDQPNSPVVQQNLLLNHSFGAQMLFFETIHKRNKVFADMSKMKDVYCISVGGSTPLGVLGYVNAVFELKNQINEGVIPKPDIIYIPVGSCGTVTGLLLGSKLAGLDFRIVGVLIAPERRHGIFASNIKKLFNETNQLLHSLDSRIPLFDFPVNCLTICKDFCGPKYGVWLPEANEARTLLYQAEKIVIEGTYSAKCLAALVKDIKNKQIDKDGIVLFWNTYCGLDFSHLTSALDYKQLDKSLHKYFIAKEL